MYLTSDIVCLKVTDKYFFSCTDVYKEQIDTKSQKKYCKWDNMSLKEFSCLRKVYVHKDLNKRETLYK